MKLVMKPENLSLLSTLLDEALDLDEAARGAWLARLSGDAAELAPTLRKLLARQASKETADLLERGPSFTLPAEVDSPTMAFQCGDTVGPYRLLRELGHGGMGEVWQAERADGSLKRKVALKLPHVTWAPALAERFAREREILASLEHPNIARLYDAGLDPHGRPYMALEYVEGLPIDEFCKQRALPVEGRLRLLLQVADAVAFAHSRLVIHRDLKPGNILVTDDGQVRLLDFGIAKLMEGEATQETALTRVGGRALTLDYASPEQIRGEPIGTPSDVYSLAVVAFELLAGARPYKLKRQRAAELEEAIAHVDAPLASAVADEVTLKRQLAGDLDAILNKALKKSAAARYPTIDALAQDWRRHLEGHAVSARPDTLTYRLNRLLQRHRVPVAAAAITVAAFGLALGVGATALVIFVLLLGLAAALWQARRAREQARLARIQAQTAEAVQNFLEDIFRANSGDQSDPIKARQRTAKELLDEGAARIEKALDNAPEAKLRVLRTLARMYEDMSESNASATLHRQRHGLAVRYFGESSVAAAHALSDLGRVLAEAEDIAGARQALDGAVAVLQRSPDPTGRAEIARDLGLATLYMRVDPKQGVLPAERALGALRQAPPSSELMLAFTLLGINLHYCKELERARQVLAEGIETAPRAPGGARSVLIELLIMLGRVSGQLGDVDSAERHFARALELSDSDTGPTGLHSLVILGLRGEMLATNGRLLEAAQSTGKARQKLLDWPDSPDRSAQIPGFSEKDAISLVRVGRPEQAVEVATLGLQYCDAVKGNLRWPASLRALRGAALLQLGQQRDAEQDLEVARALIASTGIENSWAGRFAALAEARALALRESGAAALERWLRHLHDAALPEVPSAQDVTALADLAEFELAAGLHAPALAHADQALRALSARAKRAHDTEVEAQVQLLRGSTLLKLQGAAEAVAALQQSVRLRAATMDAQRSPMLLEARLRFAEALLANGDPTAAREQWALSRDIVSQHAHLGEQYLAPMRALDHRLTTA